MLICKECSAGLIDGEDYISDIVVDHHPDLDLAIHALTKGVGDEAKRLPDVLHYLIRAIPDLYPLAALLERETGRRLTP